MESSWGFSAKTASITSSRGNGQSSMTRFSTANCVKIEVEVVGATRLMLLVPVVHMPVFQTILFKDLEPVHQTLA